MLLATFNGFYIPYNVSFNSTIGVFTIYDAIDIGIDLFFWMDIIVNFRTTFIEHKTSEEVFDSKKIAKQYLKGRFWIGKRFALN